MSILPEQRYSVVLTSRPGKPKIFTGDGDAIYVWFKDRPNPEAWQIYVHATAAYLEVSEFMDIHLPPAEPRTKKFAEVMRLVMAAMSKQDVATYNGESSKGMDLIAHQTAEKIMRLL